MGRMRKGSVLSDADIQAVTNPPAVERARAEGRRVYRAVYASGESVYLAAPSAEHARTYAVEYGIRYLGSRVISCAWDRDTSDPLTTVRSAPGKEETMAETTRKRLTAEESAKAYDRVKDLIAEGATQQEACTTVADEFGVKSWQTIRSRILSIAEDRGESAPGSRGSSAPKATATRSRKPAAAPAPSSGIDAAKAAIQAALEGFDDETDALKAKIKDLQDELKDREDERKGLLAAAKALDVPIKSREPAEETA